MAANVETMFSVREKPWHGLGMIVMEAPSQGVHHCRGKDQPLSGIFQYP